MFLCVCVCAFPEEAQVERCVRDARGAGSRKSIWPRALLLSLSSLQVGIAWLCGSSVPCSLGSGLEGSNEAPGGLQASFAYSLITDFMPMKLISPVDCSTSYLNGCFRLLIYLFNPWVTLLPTESLKSLSYTLQESEFFGFFHSSLKIVVKVNDYKT